MPILDGSSYASYVIRLSQPAVEPVEVAWRTESVDALPGKDYAETSGTVTFLPTETEKTVQVLVYGRAPGDTADRRFIIHLLPAPNVVLGTSTVDCIISVVDDGDVTVSRVTVARGASGPSAYETAKQQGFVGTAAEWMQSIKQPAIDAADEANAVREELETLLPQVTPIVDAAPELLQARDDSQSAAAASADSADAAETFAQQAMVAANVYPSVAAGIAAVADGAFFVVKGDDTASFTLLYQRIGAGGVLAASAPSIKALVRGFSVAGMITLFWSGIAASTISATTDAQISNITFLAGSTAMLTFSASNPASPLIAINGGAALPMRDVDGSDLAAGLIPTGNSVTLRYGTVPDNHWRVVDVSMKAIETNGIRDLGTAGMRQRGTLSNGADIAAITVPGIYRGSANGSYLNMPAGLASTAAFWLVVEASGGASGVGVGSFVQQTIISQIVTGTGNSAYRDAYQRRIDLASPGTSTGNEAWVPIRPSAALTDSLGLEFARQRGTLANATDLATVTRPGTYRCSANGSYLNVPAGLTATASFFLHVYSSGDTSGTGTPAFVWQEIVSQIVTAPGGAANYRQRFQRRLDLANPGTSTGNEAWVPLTPIDPYLSSLHRSKGTLATTTDLNLVWDPGIYAGASANTYGGRPADFLTGAFELVVTNAGGTDGFGSYRFVRQVMTALNVSDAGTPQAYRKQYERVIDNTAPASTSSQYAWVARHTTGRPPMAGRVAVYNGDSIPQGDGTGSFVTQLATLTGMLITNAGFGGCRLALGADANRDALSFAAIADCIANNNFAPAIAAATALQAIDGNTLRVTNANALAAIDWTTFDGYFIVNYGTNDFSAGTAIGTDADTTAATIKGAMNYGIKRILEANSKIQLIFVTPSWRARVYGPVVDGVYTPAGGVIEDSNNTPNTAFFYLRDYAQAIADRAQAFQLPVLRMDRNGGVNSYNWSQRMKDGLHDYEAIGKTLHAERMNALVRTAV